ncbi:guanine nucleotide-binding protein subunit alpha [Cystobasidiomycetes sp. EMM_F5]
MGCGASKSDDDDAKRRNDAIEAQLKQDKATAKKEIKMLLLGAGESGKSTIVKQMRLNYGYPFEENERLGYREVMCLNALQSMQTVIAHIADFGSTIPLLPHNNKNCDIVNDATVNPDDEGLSAEVTKAIAQLWQDPVIRDKVAHSNTFQLNDSASYFFDEINRIGGANYIPTDEDIIRSRVKTTGITEVKFAVRDLIYRVFDVGGQRSERKKWIHCFEGVQCLIFIVAISEYDQTLYEDEATNRIDEASTLWDSVSNSRWFAQSSLVLFLNKTDLFKAKLLTSPLGQYMQAYEGPGDWGSASQYMLAHFTALLKNPQKRLYSQFTCATDTEQTKFVLSALQDFIIKQNLAATVIIPPICGVLGGADVVYRDSYNLSGCRN